MEQRVEKRPIAVFLGDLHWRLTKPLYRIETKPFEQVIGGKLAMVAAFARKHRVPVFLAGDLFDRSRGFLDLWTLRRWMNDLFWANHDSTEPASPPVPVYAVRGQHDMFHHTDDPATSFNLLRDTCPHFRVLGGRDFVQLSDPSKSSPRIFASVYGQGWKDELPDCDAPFAILLAHRTFWHRKPIYPGQTSGNVASESVKLASAGYRMVFSGDNHLAFDVTIGGVEFHNLGAFTRNDVTLRNQRPRFCVLYDDLSVEPIYVGDVDVFDLETSDADKGRDDAQDGFSLALAGGFEYGDTFVGGIDRVVSAGVCGDAKLTERQCNLLKDVRSTI